MEQGERAGPAPARLGPDGKAATLSIPNSIQVPPATHHASWMGEDVDDSDPRRRWYKSCTCPFAAFFLSVPLAAGSADSSSPPTGEQGTPRWPGSEILRRLATVPRTDHQPLGPSWGMLRSRPLLRPSCKQKTARQLSLHRDSPTRNARPQPKSTSSSQKLIHTGRVSQGGAATVVLPWNLPRWI